MSTQRKLSLIAIVLGVVIGFIALWSWALYGMPLRIQGASIVTTFTFIFVGGMGMIE